MVNNCLPPWLVAFFLLLGFLSVGKTAEAQKPAKKEQTDVIGANGEILGAADILTVKDCVKLMRADSVHMFFDKRYALTQPDCAVYRRESRMNVKGEFDGVVLDYSHADNRLMYKDSYSNGVRDGLYEQYYGNTQLAIRGQFKNGVPSGIWQEWYPEGHSKQTLEVSPQQPGPIRVLAFWNAAGLPMVVNGMGKWTAAATDVVLNDVVRITKGPQSSTFSSTVSTFHLPMTFGGPIVNGYQEGIWEARNPDNAKLIRVEVFRAGRLERGRFFGEVMGTDVALNETNRDTANWRYKTRPKLTVRLMDEPLEVEPFRMGIDCELQAIADEATMALVPLRLNSTVVVPRPPVKEAAYRREVLEKVTANESVSNVLPQTEGESVAVTAAITTQGELTDFTSKSKVLASYMGSLLPTLGPWQPATINGKPVPGKVRVVLQRHNKKLQISMRPNLVYPAPPEFYETQTKE